MKRNISSLVLMAVIAAGVGSLAGCASGSSEVMKQNSDSVASKIIRGKTTKSQVRAEFGEPTSVSNSPDGETWSYVGTKSNISAFIPFYSSGESVGVNSLEVTFNRAGIVKNYEFSGKRATK